MVLSFLVSAVAVIAVVVFALLFEFVAEPLSFLPSLRGDSQRLSRCAILCRSIGYYTNIVSS
jgi:hypothetical protein